MLLSSSVKVGSYRIPAQVCTIISRTLKVKFRYSVVTILSELGGIDRELGGIDCWPQIIYLFIHFSTKPTI